jgi:hypothetical protein
MQHDVLLQIPVIFLVLLEIKNNTNLKYVVFFCIS